MSRRCCPKPAAWRPKCLRCSTVPAIAGASIKDGVVTTAPGWKDAYDAWRKGGWNGLTAPTEWGGQALPHVLNAACVEMWNAASMAFAVGPLVGMSAVDAFTTHGKI